MTEAGKAFAAAGKMFEYSGTMLLKGVSDQYLFSILQINQHKECQEKGINWKPVLISQVRMEESKMVGIILRLFTWGFWAVV